MFLMFYRKLLRTFLFLPFPPESQSKRSRIEQSRYGLQGRTVGSGELECSRATSEHEWKGDFPVCPVVKTALPMQGLWVQSLVWELRLMSLIFLIFINLIGIKCNFFCFAFSWWLIRSSIFYFINYPLSFLFNQFLFLYFGYFSLVGFCQLIGVHCAKILIYYILIFTIYLILIIISWGKTPWWACG